MRERSQRAFKTRNNPIPSAAAGQPRGVQRGGRRSTRERRPPGPSRQHGAERGEPSDVHEQHTARGLRRGQAGPGREVTVSAPNAGLWPHVEGWKVDWSLTPELVLPKHGLACALPYKPRLWDTGGLCQASTWRGAPGWGPALGHAGGAAAHHELRHLRRQQPVQQLRPLCSQRRVKAIQ